VKGMKMPRGNKDNIMRYKIPAISLAEQQQVVNQIHKYTEQINASLNVMQDCANRKKAVIEHYLS
ncbi:MAG: hypothetical protein SO193_06320, partial [Sodaliphilus sp.]|nr:hypothetical protein [Sodaliphilus sp.]